MNIYKEFQPTYLYIKQHFITGKRYFGKTIKNPEIYNGSGKYWKNHIKKHGKEHIVTIWYCLFYDKESITEFALMCSNQWNIVESTAWANQTPENGLGGCSKGHLKGVLVGNKNPNYNNKWSDKQRLSASKRQTGKNKGKTYEEMYGEDKAKELKEQKRIRLLGKDNSGKNNPRALKIKAISPDGVEYLIEGNVDTFCKEHKLGASNVRTSYNHNIPHYLGWKFIKLPKPNSL